MFGDVEIVSLGLVMNFTNAVAVLLEDEKKQAIATTLTKVK